MVGRVMAGVTLAYAARSIVLSEALSYVARCDTLGCVTLARVSHREGYELVVFKHHLSRPSDHQDLSHIFLHHRAGDRRLVLRGCERQGGLEV